MSDYVPNVRMRRVGRALLSWRDAAGLTAAELAKKTGWSAAKQSRLDNMTQAILPAEVMTVALILGIPADERDAVFNSCLAAQEKGWWEQVSRDALVADVLDYVELESEAATVRIFKIDLVPGLLQTPEYAAAIFEADRPRISPEIRRQRVEARTGRQERLTGENPIRVEAVLTEGVLRRQVGGPAVMRKQLDRLIELGSLSNVEVRMIPESTGAYPAMGTPFCILSFVSGYPDVGYVELLDKGVYLEEPDVVAAYRTNFLGLREVALSARKSRALIEDIAREMG